MQEWTVAQYETDFDDENVRICISARKYHFIMNKFDVSLREAQMLWFCTAYMDSDKLSLGVMKAYSCTLEEAAAIVEGANWGKPGNK